ncbi:ADP-ribosylation factor-like protein 6-interacting protein 1 [Planococcus citri]|uniref:ADP-ribosylation factor-like protein 6-interacting protein 1 n=1 Tax=Planococcus citri TaxID=170843 RepID=UPI0031F9CEB5
MSSQNQEMDLSAKKIKHSLENWREIVLPVYEVLLWKNIPLYPALIFGISTIAFIIVILLDPTLLSFASSLALFLVLLDYFAPIVISKIFNPQSWTGPKEKKLDEICSNLACSYISVKSSVAYFCSLKETNPKLYYLPVIFGLLFLSWIGNNVNNVFLTYVFVTVLLMIPGANHHGYLEKFSSLLKQVVAQTLRSALGKKEKKQ